MRHNNIINMCKDLGWCPAHLLVGGRGQCQRDNSVMCGNIASIGELELENVRDQKWKARCAQACVKSDPPKSKQNKVNYLCDTKALIEVSNRIRPTSDSSASLCRIKQHPKPLSLLAVGTKKKTSEASLK